MLSFERAFSQMTKTIMWEYHQDFFPQSFKKSAMYLQKNFNIVLFSKNVLHNYVSVKIQQIDIWGNR